ncbi:MAG: Spy/CpxP family protein refolding chaperone [Polyangiaceae bacterium]|jgi:hypothetical protein
MLGVLIGAVCVIGIFKAVRRARRWGYGYGQFAGPWGYGGGCGHRGGWHGGYDGYDGADGWRDDSDLDDSFSPWGGGGRGGRGRGFFGLRGLFARLETTPAQEKAIKGALEELRTKGRAVKDDARGMRGDLANALRGESLDAETLGAVASRASGAVDALRDSAIGAVLKVHEVLDERQRRIVAELIESGPRFGRGWGGRRR